MNALKKIAVEVVVDEAACRCDEEDEYRISAEEEALEKQDKLDDLYSDAWS